MSSVNADRLRQVPSAHLPPAGFDFDPSVADIKACTATIVSTLKSTVSDVAGVAAPNRTLDNTLLAFHAGLNRASALQVHATFPSMVHANAEVRAASADAKTKLKQAFDEAYANPDVYAALVAIKDQVPTADGEIKYLYEKTLALHQLNGMGISDPAQRTEFMDLKRTIAELEQIYTQRINEDTTSFTVSSIADLSGLPDSFIKSLARTDAGEYILTTKTPDYLAIMMSATSRALRKRMYQAYNARCTPANESTLAELLIARNKAARLAGFKSHAHMKLHVAMAGDPTKLQFMDDLAEQLQPKRAQDVADLIAALGVDEAPQDGLQVWDLAYAQAQLKRAKYAVDENKVAEYFPLEHVLATILRIYEDLFALEFVAADNMQRWHEDVRAYTVYTAPKEKGQEKELVGHFYLDLHPRKGKYGHQCVAPLMPATSNGGDNGTKTYPVAANIGNLTKPAPGTPSLLKFSEVRTFFHEFGHVVHCLLTASTTSLTSWSWSLNPYPGGVEVDFLELPSQMLENWIYTSRVLNKLSKHYETGATLPDELKAKLAALRKLGGGLAYTRQVYMSQFDQVIHGPGFVDGLNVDEVAAKVRNTWVELQRKVHGTELPEGASPWASWYHLCGYDAAYHSYLSSEVFSHDCFAEWERRGGDLGCLNSDVAKEYADEILVPGATKDGMSMLRGFLKREPQMGPFLKHVLD
ncbi:hypothetical protein BCR44DRAFT_1402589 [Catenaria anguillulae PL171]|uniref:Peptidase M3A/M3B catalytic domain-containing protein n=1 Tax=Catenaria anguillulae PL171 TaxID=765915 RepID=A0A1Y2HM51_9FUNG|nr:hypothetical protein BCR44DRAFT_1402589 [Catenaria anguillulae PL171]